ncbi:MAG: ABC transporter substrate-binding protein, partial [Chloroflexota bacterium]|nr:ABC transporter substrate-binding protein [Chloroflexota bacterium]
GFGLLTLDVTNAIGKTALLVKGTDNNYDISFDNPTNKQFVAAFKKKFNRDPELAQFQYDGLILLDKALELAKGDKSPDSLVSALEKVPSFDSVRGKVKIDPETHGLIQSWYLAVAAEENGKVKPQIKQKLVTLAPTSVFTGTL